MLNQTITEELLKNEIYHSFEDLAFDDDTDNTKPIKVFEREPYVVIDNFDDIDTAPIWHLEKETDIVKTPDIVSTSVDVVVAKDRLEKKRQKRILEDQNKLEEWKEFLPNEPKELNNFAFDIIDFATEVHGEIESCDVDLFDVSKEIDNYKRKIEEDSAKFIENLKAQNGLVPIKKSRASLSRSNCERYMKDNKHELQKWMSIDYSNQLNTKSFPSNENNDNLEYDGNKSTLIESSSEDDDDAIRDPREIWLRNKRNREN
ncbi:hypothetical protein SNEBB_009782 [Seison nebaliae]|nr:hypothetical protein SNEBB_009782 [Seison nebaliae]